MPEVLFVDPDALREQVRIKHRDVAADPHRTFHFHTGRPLAARLGYYPAAVDPLPDHAVESFAGVGNPFSPRALQTGKRVVDVGSGAGFDSFIAAGQVGSTGRVVGVDMTSEMLEKARHTSAGLGYKHVGFRDGLAEALPVDDGLGGRRDFERRHQPVRGQAGCVHRDPACAQTRWVVAVRGHRQRTACPGRRVA